MEAVKFWLKDDGIRLSAVLEKPDRVPCPIAVIIHGFTGHKDEPHILAVNDAFHELGLATLRVDMYGHGESEGQFYDHTLFKWMTNAMTAIDYARSLDFVTDLYLCGHSQGGLMVMLASALERDRVCGLIPLSPAAMIPERARRGELLGVFFDPEHIPREITCDDGWVLGGNYLRVAQMIDVDAAIDRYSGPVLIVHGDEDESVPYQVGVEAAKRYRDGTLIPVHGDDHCFDYHLDKMVEAVKGWLEPRLQKDTSKKGA